MLEVSAGRICLFAIQVLDRVLYFIGAACKSNLFSPPLLGYCENADRVAVQILENCKYITLNHPRDEVPETVKTLLSTYVANTNVPPCKDFVDRIISYMSQIDNGCGFARTLTNSLSVTSTVFDKGFAAQFNQLLFARKTKDGSSINMMDDQHQRLRAVVALLYHKNQQVSARILPNLHDDLTDLDEDLRAVTADLVVHLMSQEPNFPKDYPTLFTQYKARLSDISADVRHRCVENLHRFLDHTPTEVVPSLLTLLKPRSSDKDDDVRKGFVTSLLSVAKSEEGWTRVRQLVPYAVGRNIRQESSCSSRVPLWRA